MSKTWFKCSPPVWINVRIGFLYFVSFIFKMDDPQVSFRLLQRNNIRPLSEGHVASQRQRNKSIRFQNIR